MKSIKNIFKGTVGLSVLLINGLPVYGKSNTEPSILSTSMNTGIETVEKTGNIISESLQSITVEDIQPVTTYEAEYIPTYSYSEPYVEIQDTSTTMTVDEFMALYGQMEEETVPVDTSSQEEAYQVALANYNSALAEYEAANQMIETTKEVEVEIIEEVTDEEGNVSEVVRTEIQTVTEIVPAGDVVSAQANLDAAKAALDNVQMALDSANTSVDTFESKEAKESYTYTESTISDKNLIEDEIINVEEKTFASSGTCGDNLTWTLDDDQLLTISGSGSMFDFAGYSSPPWGKSIKRIIINNGVTSIGNYAFSNCSGLTDITVANSVKSIGKYAFYNCTSLKDITIPEGVTSIGSCTFTSCSSLKEIIIPDGVTGIGDNAFANCASLTNIVIPSSVTNIEHHAFLSCTSLKEIIILDGVTSIGNYAFQLCTYLTKVSLPDSITSIGDGAFNRCTSLNDINIPNKITRIERETFGVCNSLKQLLVTDKITYIGKDAFKGCSLYVYPDSYALGYAISNDIPYEIFLPVESLVIHDMTVLPGTTKQIIYTISPDNCSDPTVIWTSSDDKIASVDDNGIITAKKIGTVTITASVNKGSLTAQCNVKVAVPVEGITLSQDNAKLNVGDILNVEAQITPEDATEKTITWTSSNESVATVNNGQITALKTGSAVITAVTLDGNYAASCNVTVLVPVEQLTLDHTELKMNRGNQYQLTATILPDNAADKSIVWTSSDTSIATVEDGLITALKQGEAVISASAFMGRFVKKCTVKVIVPVEGITLSQYNAKLNVGDILNVEAQITPEDATEKTITWTSSNPSVATVNNGQITALKGGETVITAITLDGNYTASCNITVQVPVEQITLDHTELKMNLGNQYQLAATILPDNAADKTISWTSSNPNIATVEDGLITALKQGSVTITASVNNGNLTAKCNVKIVVPVEGIALSQSDVILNVDDILNIEAQITPEDATEQTITWTSSNESVVTVNNGQVTALKAGSAVITAVTLDGNYTASCNVTVLVPVEQLTLDHSELTMIRGNRYQLTATILPDNAADKSIVWTSSDTSIATVEDGLITALKQGEVVISASAYMGRFIKKCTVKIIVPVEGITLSQNSAKLNVGDILNIEAKITPEDATEQTIIWISSDPSVVAVNNGSITALKSGSAVVKASNLDGSISDSCHINVVIPATGITLDQTEVKLNRGEEYLLTATISPADATNKNVIWTSDNTNVATVTDGLIKALNRGKAVITATTEDGHFKAVCNVEVIIKTSGITLDTHSEMLWAEEAFQLNASIEPSDADIKDVIWSSSDESIATVQDGLVYAIKTGNVTITAETKEGGFKDTCNIEIRQAVSGIKLNRTTASLTKGQTLQLNVTLNPSNAYNKKVTWASSDTNIVTVNNGLVTAKKVGDADISVVAEDGNFKAVCHIEVKLPFTDVSKDAWYYDTARECYETGLVNGTSSTTFSPTQTMTRAMVVTILWRMEGSPTVEFNDKFKDVQSTQWYANPISWAEKSGVVHGYGDSTFKPDAAVTREQIAVMLSNYAGYKKKYQAGTAQYSTYPDGDQVSSWAETGMKWALTNGIISGNGAGYLNPKKSATRAEGAAMLLRMKNWL